MVKSTLYVISLMFALMTRAQVMYPSNPAFVDDNYRAFDFWIGEWDVNLKIKNESNEWPVSKKAHVKVFPVLQGKAVMELWNEKKEGLDAIQGFSLRYYNKETDKWDLILHWPRPNWGRTAIFQGEETHGRFDFHISYPINDSTTQMAKYSFSDISENSLRWQDFYSQDNGSSWTANWIMEFTRTAKYPKALTEKEAHTYLDGSRCSADQYSAITDLASVKSFEWKGERYATTAYKILDGCATVIFGSNNTYPVKEKLLLFTFHTPESKYEVIELSNDTNPLGRYRGSFIDNVFSFESVNSDSSVMIKMNEDGESFSAE